MLFRANLNLVLSMYIQNEHYSSPKFLCLIRFYYVLIVSKVSQRMNIMENGEELTRRKRRRRRE